MTPIARSKILEVHGGDPQNLPFLYFLMSHSHGLTLIETLKKKGLKGRLLTEFIQAKFGGEPIKLLKWTLKETLNVNAPKTPKVGRNGLLI